MSCYDADIENRIRAISYVIFDSILNNYDDVFDSISLDVTYKDAVGEKSTIAAAKQYQFYPDIFQNSILRTDSPVSIALRGVIERLNTLSDNDTIETLNILCSDGSVDDVLSNLKDDKIKSLYKQLLDDTEVIPSNFKMQLILSQKVGRTRLKRDLLVYRGLKMPIDDAQQLQVGSIFKDNAFQSTTCNPAVAKTFGYNPTYNDSDYTLFGFDKAAVGFFDTMEYRAYLIKFKLKPGDNALCPTQYTKSSSSQSYGIQRGEAEILLPPGKEYRVIDINHTARVITVEQI